MKIILTRLKMNQNYVLTHCGSLTSTGRAAWTERVRLVDTNVLSITNLAFVLQKQLFIMNAERSINSCQRIKHKNSQKELMLVKWTVHILIFLK